MKKILNLLVMSGAALAALFLLANLARIGGAGNSQAVSLRPASSIEDGAVVSIEYTLSDDSGNIIDSSVGKEPLTFVQGAGQIVPGLEKALHGLKTGERRKVQVKPEEGYGMRNDQAFQELPRESIPAEAQKVGAALMAKAPDGQTIPIRVHQVKEKTVVVDFNHPLAGKTLNFDVEVKDIKAAAR